MPIVRRLAPVVINDRSGGFTLVELLTVLVVIAIVAGLAAPAVGQFLESNRLSSATNTLLADLSLARSEAVKRQEGQVVICTSSTGAGCSGDTVAWSAGWIVFWDKDSSGSLTADDELLKVQGALPASLNTTTTPGNTDLIAYTRLGSQATAINSLQLANTELGATRLICINAIGRASLMEGPTCT